MILTNIIPVERTSSSNNYLIELLTREKIPEFTCINVLEQITGRGFGTNNWESETGKNLTVSMLFYPTFINPDELFCFNMCVALAVSDMVRSFITKLPVSIKWPNDIYIGEKKVSGILIENSFTNNTLEYSIAGIGININQLTFKSDAPNPISFKTILTHDIDLDVALHNLCNCLLERYMQLKQTGTEAIKNEYHARLYRKNVITTFKTENAEFKAILTGVSDSGSIQLKKLTGEMVEFGFKEIVYK